MTELYFPLPLQSKNFIMHSSGSEYRYLIEQKLDAIIDSSSYLPNSVRDSITYICASQKHELIALPRKIYELVNVNPLLLQSHLLESLLDLENVIREVCIFMHLKHSNKHPNILFAGDWWSGCFYIP
jgi:hypothetical protein